MTELSTTNGRSVEEVRASQTNVTGQHSGYIVLSEAERAKGFVRPYRDSYRHVGPPVAQHPLRDLTDSEREQYSDAGYVKFEQYPEDRLPVTGRFWTQADIDKAGVGCRIVTTMRSDIAETYARNPRFYGATFCCGCNRHLPVDEFVWDGTDQRVGS